MGRQYFGTDGIRGRVGQQPMTVDFAMRLASAAARVLAPEGGRVMIGKDTRVSGYMFESALEAGFVAAGMDVGLLGPLPTPAIAYLTRESGADLGVVISASHNPFYDNGIKFFDREGAKLSDQLELAIEACLEQPAVTRESTSLGRAKRVDTALEDYQRFCISGLPAGFSLDGMKIVIDCAHGAGYKAGPRVLAALGAEIVPIGCSPNGRNINDGCGSTRPELLQLTVPGVRADLGIALDGDADRLVMVDHQGQLIDGDLLLFILATAWRQSGTLAGPVVGTLMSNLGLELALRERGIGFERASVGDRYVLERLQQTGGILGGETSGHVICLNKTTTGDALIAALQVLAVLRASGRSLAELAAQMPRFPQVLINVPVQGRPQVATPVISAAVSRIEERLGQRGRVVLRPSGTEPVVRVMVEGENPELVRAAASELAEVVRDNGS
ncbi:MAG: phosphoglucosamine mutase [Chromatiales bacterium]|nr:phosphoglucosamine mutase [Chromatiales bacterium]